MAYVFRTSHDYFPIAEDNGWFHMGCNVNEGVVISWYEWDITRSQGRGKAEDNKNDITWVEGIQLASIAVCNTCYAINFLHSGPSASTTSHMHLHGFSMK